jgi:hypothetical protein
MVAWIPAARTAMKVAPFALEIARQLDRQLRPHVLAYQFARSVDGWVGKWTSPEGGHWLVFNHPSGEMLRAFPPLKRSEAELVEREFDRGTLEHHSDLPEAKVRDAAMAIRSGPGRTRRRLTGGEGEDEVIDVEVIDVDRDDPPGR